MVRGLRANFASDMQDDVFVDHVFSDESTIHLSGYVNTYNVRIWDSNPRTMVQVRDSLKLNVFGGKFKELSILVKKL